MLCDNASCPVLHESNQPLPWNSMDFLYLTKEGLETLSIWRSVPYAQTIIIRDKILALSVVKPALQDHFLSWFMLPSYLGVLFSVDVCKERWQRYFLKFNLVPDGICKIYFSYYSTWRFGALKAKFW